MTYTTFDETWAPFYLAQRGTHKKRAMMRESDKKTKVIFAAGDVFRFKLWSTPDAAPDLDIDSVSGLDGGSTINVIALGDATIDAEVEVVFARVDLAELAAGEYVGELAYVDSQDGNHYKPIARGPVYLRSSPTGDFGAT